MHQIAYMPAPPAASSSASLDWALIVGIVALVIALPTLFFQIPQIVAAIRNLRLRHRLVLIGPQKAGKTSLWLYLNNKVVPDRITGTYGFQKRGRIVYDLTGEKTFYFRARELIDQGGEFPKSWEGVIRRYNPDGIIFVVDTSNRANE